MYTPKHFEVTDKAVLLAFMRQYPFATLVSSLDNRPVATHLPFLVEEREGGVFLVSHMALANQHWKQLEEIKESLVIFNEPHAYISTAFYGDTDKVPTWNYVAIHAYGPVRILHEDTEKKQVLQNMISTYHAPDLVHFHAMDPKYFRKMLKGIVAFEQQVTSLEGKFKMSQNRKEEERKNIIRHFEEKGDAMQKEVANLIKKSGPKTKMG